MLAHDHLLQLHRATPDDAKGIAELHDASLRTAIRVARGHVDGLRVQSDSAETLWRNNLQLSSGDLRPWVGVQADRTVGFVSVGPSRDADAGPDTGELYVTDIDFEKTDDSGARALFHHACSDLRHLGFSEATVWVVARDAQTRSLLESVGWTLDVARRWHRVSGVPLLEYRYRAHLV